MQRIAQRSLAWILAMALVVAGLPMAHAMPDASTVPMHAAMQHHAGISSDMAVSNVAVSDVVMTSDAGHAHHHDGMVMDAMSGQDDDGQPQSSAPCKCLNCSMCVTSYVASPLRFPTPERRTVAVIYRMASAGIAGIAVRVDPGIPILAV